jgi:hypothetical protein
MVVRLEAKVWRWCWALYVALFARSDGDALSCNDLGNEVVRVTNSGVRDASRRIHWSQVWMFAVSTGLGSSLQITVTPCPCGGSKSSSGNELEFLAVRGCM